ncbi:MAG: hypothetical protein E7466_08100 [Ruminococcaceae bacterium]|nr:hypothetical protein [Oscillospiraceae bacterium]
MKKIVAILLALMLLSGCATKEKPAPTAASTTQPSSTTEPTQPSEQPPEDTPAAPQKAAVSEVVSCCFKEQVLPTDFEAYVGHFPAVEGKVYVDLMLRVRNTGETDIGAEDITGWFEYLDQRLAMQLELEKNVGDFENVDKQIHPGQTRTAHLFYTVDAAAAESEMVVHYTVLGESAEITVDDYVPPVLENKHPLSVGGTYTQEGEYTLEVLKCVTSDYIQATGAGAVKYYVQGYTVLDLVVKVYNEGAAGINHLEGYLVLDGQVQGAAEELEVNENTELESLTSDSVIAAGEEAVVHLWVAVPVGTDPAGQAMRLNIMDECFYCVPIA